MASGYIIISVRRAGNESFGELESGKTAQRMKYDDASRERSGRRDAVVELAKKVRDTWQHNHYAYNDASFRIEDVDSETGEIQVISGIPYNRPDNSQAVRQALVDMHADPKTGFLSRGKKVPPSALADWLFLNAEAGKLPAVAMTLWANLELSERVELCREVAAGICIPAIQG